MLIRPVTPEDRQPLSQLLSRIETFSAEEVKCALELIDLALTPNHPDYRVLVATRDRELLGYVCFGPTPMTEKTFDLYWIASDPSARGQGVGSSLVAGMEAEIRQRHGHLIRVETSATEAYGPTRGFYEGMKYTEEARIKNFYKEGDDLIILTKRV